MRKFRVQLTEYFMDHEWSNIEAYDAEEAAKTIVSSHIWEDCNFDSIGKETFVVHVDDGTGITTWDVDTEPTFHCYATMKE